MIVVAGALTAIAACASSTPEPVVQPVTAPVKRYAPQNPFETMGRASLAAGETERATYEFEEALRVNPFDPVSLNNLAVAKAEQGDYHSAVELLSRASRLAPENYEVAANLARLRNWMNSEALAGVEPQGPAMPKSADWAALPPPPPALWAR